MCSTSLAPTCVRPATGIARLSPNSRPSREIAGRRHGREVGHEHQHGHDEQADPGGRGDEAERLAEVLPRNQEGIDPEQERQDQHLAERLEHERRVGGEDRPLPAEQGPRGAGRACLPNAAAAAAARLRRGCASLRDVAQEAQRRQKRAPAEAAAVTARDSTRAGPAAADREAARGPREGRQRPGQDGEQVGEPVEGSKVPPPTAAMAVAGGRTCRPITSASPTPMPATSRAVRKRERSTAASGPARRTPPAPAGAAATPARCTTAASRRRPRAPSGRDDSHSAGSRISVLIGSAYRYSRKPLAATICSGPHGQHAQELQVLRVGHHRQRDGDRRHEQERPATAAARRTGQDLGVPRGGPRGEQAPSTRRPA